MKHINLRLPVAEWESLDIYCEGADRSKNDVIRELIRNGVEKLQAKKRKAVEKV